MTRILPCVLVVLMAAVPPQRDPSPPAVRRIPVGTGVISGTITTADTGRPVRGARVSLVGNMPVARAAVTDAQGTFSFERLPAGQYSIGVSRNGFLPASFGQKKPGGPGTTFALADGQKAAADIQMIRGGVISGRALGEDGEPMSNAQIRAWRYVSNAGVKRLQQTDGATSDDRGEYRLFGLQPGDYLVSSTPNNNDMVMSGRLLADAALIEQAIASGVVQPPARPGQPATVTIPMPAPQPMQMRNVENPLRFKARMTCSRRARAVRTASISSGVRGAIFPEIFRSTKRAWGTEWPGTLWVSFRSL